MLLGGQFELHADLIIPPNIHSFHDLGNNHLLGLTGYLIEHGCPFKGFIDLQALGRQSIFRCLMFQEDSFVFLPAFSKAEGCFM